MVVKIEGRQGGRGRHEVREEEEGKRPSLGCGEPWRSRRNGRKSKEEERGEKEEAGFDGMLPDTGVLSGRKEISSGKAVDPLTSTPCNFLGSKKIQKKKKKRSHVSARRGVTPNTTNARQQL